MPEVLEGVWDAGRAGVTAPHIMADWLTLFQLGEEYYAHPGFSELRPCPTPTPPPPMFGSSAGHVNWCLKGVIPLPVID